MDHITRMLFLSGRKRTLNTLTFSSSQSWTAPSNVSLLTTVTGLGGAGSPAYWTPTVVGRARTQNGTVNVTGTGYVADYSEPYNWAVNWRDGLNSYGTGERLMPYSGKFAYYQYIDQQSVNSYNFPSNLLGLVQFWETDVFGQFYIRGSAYLSIDAGAPTSGTINNSTVYYYSVIAEALTDPVTGPSSQGFGLTFAGGNGGAASPVTYTNIAITPGTNYSITVASGGYVTINYFT